MLQDAALSSASISLPQQAEESSFLWHDRLGLMLGAGAVGAVGGFIATLTIGRIEPWLAPACAGPVYLAAAYLGWERLRDAHARRAWATLALLVLHIGALLAWPAIFFLPPEQAILLAFGPPLSLLLLVGVPIAPGDFNRASAQALLVGGLAVSQLAAFVLGA